MMGTQDVTLTVELDAGVFGFLWRYLEAKSVDAERYSVMVPEYQEMIERGLASFRAAAEAPVPQPKVRRRPLS